MDTTLMDVLIIAAGILIRLGIPVAITLLLGWYLKRLDARWQAEAEAEVEATLRRVKMLPRPQTSQAAVRCWEVKNCSQERRQSCPAHLNPDYFCWQHFQSNGHVPSVCSDCQVYKENAPLAA